MKIANSIPLCAAWLFCSAGVVNAQTRGGFEISAEVLDYSYRERVEDAIIACDDGTFAGVGVTYVETIGGGFLLRARLNAVVGSADYQAPATDLSGAPTGTSRIEAVPQSFGQLELHIAKDFSLGQGTLTPFIGLGSRYLEDESGGRTTDDGLLGYDREVSYAYVPIGLAAQLPVSERARLIISGQYNVVTHGHSKSRLSGLDPRIADLEVGLNGGDGFEISALASLPIGRGSMLNFGPFLRQWNIEQSESAFVEDPDDTGQVFRFFEPNNRTTEFGLRLSYSF